MRKVAIIYGSSLGNTQYVAEKIHQYYKEAECLDVSDVTPFHINQYEFLIMGTSTWGLGEMQDDFDPFVDRLMTMDLAGKKIALFGLGDQQTYPDTFCDGMGKLYEMLKPKGVFFVGSWPTDGYDFSGSLALIGDELKGLAIDEDNEPDLTDMRVKNWVKKIKAEILSND